LYLRSFSVVPTSEDFASPLSYPPLARGDEGGCMIDYRQNNALKHNARLLSVTEKSLMSINPVLLVNSVRFLE
jgi:hypothetical protein